MFGYIKPMECELKLRDYELYRAAYCGLCRTIGKRCGFLSRMALNYDCTFLLVFYLALMGEGRLIRSACMKPSLKKRLFVVDSPALDYVADVNVLLAYCQREDVWVDDRRVSALAARTALAQGAGLAKRRQPALYTSLQEGLKRLGAIEREKLASLDEPACAFGEILRDIALLLPNFPEREKTATSWMFYNLGRWIYLMDAWEDREKDAASGSYNPFVLCKAKREDAAFQLYFSLDEAEKAYELIDFKRDSAVTDNIIHLGCRLATRRLLGEEKEETNESIQGFGRE